MKCFSSLQHVWFFPRSYCVRHWMLSLVGICDVVMDDRNLSICWWLWHCTKFLHAQKGRPVLFNFNLRICYTNALLFVIIVVWDIQRILLNEKKMKNSYLWACLVICLLIYNWPNLLWTWNRFSTFKWLQV